MIKKEEKMSENVAVADEISVEDFFELTQADQEEVESIYGLDSTDRRQIENVVNQFIEENEFNIDDAAERKAAGEHFMDEYNDNEKEWDGVVDRDKIENAMRYAVAYIAYTNDLNEEQTYEMQHIKLFENFECDEAEVTTEEAKNALGRLYSGIKEGDDFANLFKDGSNAKPVNENGDKDRYARTVKDLDDVRPRMAPAPKPAGMMASEGTKYFDLYLQDQASYIMCDKYGYEKGILNWEYVLGKSSGAMFAASAEIVNQKLQMLRDLGILQEYGKDYFKRSYFDLWKEWKSANSGKLKAAA